MRICARWRSSSRGRRDERDVPGPVGAPLQRIRRADALDGWASPSTVLDARTPRSVSRDLAPEGNDYHQGDSDRLVRELQWAAAVITVTIPDGDTSGVQISATAGPGTAAREDVSSLRVPSDFRPYIFSHEEIVRLLRAARELPALTSDPLRPWSMELVVVLLYTAGLRIGEVVRLEVRDYEATAATLVIRETKFAKTRLIALSTSAQRVLDAYLARRREFGLRCDPTDPLRCCPSNHPPCVGGTQVALTRLMRGCGLKPPRGRVGPRVHDVRHSFAVHRVLEWYRQGQNVQALLPRLVTYMGHRGLASTQRYLALTPAVLREAGTLFETFGAVGPTSKVLS